MSYGQPPSGGYGYGPPGYGYGPQMPMGPRQHAWANAALGLGLAGVLCGGALLGVPAILLGRKVVKAVQAEPRVWRGALSAQVGIVFGWISVVETAIFLTVKLSFGFRSSLGWIALAATGLALLALGALRGLPKPVAAVTSLVRRAPLAVGLSFGGILIGGALGASKAAASEQAAAKRCADARQKYAQDLSVSYFSTARSSVDAIQRECVGTVTDLEVAAMRHDVDAKEADAKKRADDEKAATLATLAADNEKTAVVTFPEARKVIASGIKSAQTFVWQGKFEDAETELDRAQRNLDRFKGTSVEGSADFKDLSRQIAEKRKAIQPQLDRIAEKRARQTPPGAGLTTAAKVQQIKDECRIRSCNPAVLGSIYSSATPEERTILHCTARWEEDAYMCRHGDAWACTPVKCP